MLNLIQGPNENVTYLSKLIPGGQIKCIGYVVKTDLKVTPENVF